MAKSKNEVKKEKEGLDNKLTGFESASKDLDTLLRSQRTDKNKEGLGYSAVPYPLAQVYSPPKKDLSWTGLPEFVDDTITDYSMPTPSIDISNNNTSDIQSNNSSVSELEESTSSIILKPMIKFMKVVDCPRVPKTKNIENTRKSTFWITVAIKQVNDVTRLQALVDKKKVVVTEVAIREVLQLDDAEGVDCLRNEEIFTKLARMGYEKPSTKFTFYKAFFLSQWKFLIHTILLSMSAKRTSWNEFSSAMASTIICLSTEDVTAAQGDDAVALMDDKKEDKKDEEAKEDKPAEVQEVVDVVTIDKLITEVVTAASEIVTAASTIISTTEPQVPAFTITAAPAKVAAAPSRRRKGVDKGKGILVEEPKPLKKKQQIEMDEEYARKLHAELNKDIDCDVAIDHTKEQMEEEESRALQRINETPIEREAKRRKLDEEVGDLKIHLEKVPDEDDDVYTEATPLARKTKLRLLMTSATAETRIKK
nr:hypothetical protein [Tanacetum cinerariifolium]